MVKPLRNAAVAAPHALGRRKQELDAKRRFWHQHEKFIRGVRRLEPPPQRKKPNFLAHMVGKTAFIKLQHFRLSGLRRRNEIPHPLLVLEHVPVFYNEIGAGDFSDTYPPADNHKVIFRKLAWRKTI